MQCGEVRVDSSGGRVSFITGANAGIGKELARQQAMSGQYRKIYLGCRDRNRAAKALSELKSGTGKAIFEIAIVDVANLASVKAAITSLKEPVDDLVMNAGGAGGKTPLALTKDGVTEIFASNVLGHVALLEGLIAAGKLRRAAVYAGSEAARGVPKLGMKRPAVTTGSVDEFAALCNGRYFDGRKPDDTLAYGQVKLVAALWLSSLARRHPELRLITMSPGNTSGTEVARDFPLPVRVLMKYVLTPVVMPLLGIVQSVGKGARRHVDALDDDALKTGVFYASKADALTGPVVDQSTIMPELANTTYQDHADQAVHRFITV